MIEYFKLKLLYTFCFLCIFTKGTQMAYASGEINYQHDELGYLFCGQQHFPNENQINESGGGFGLSFLNENSSYYTGELNVKDFCFLSSYSTKNKDLSSDELSSLNSDGFSGILDTKRTAFFNYSSAKFYSLFNGTPVINPVFVIPTLGLGGMYGFSLGHRISNEEKIQINDLVENVKKETGNDLVVDVRVGIGAMFRYKFFAGSLRVHIYAVRNFELATTGDFNNRVHLYGTLIFSIPDIKTRNSYYKKYDFFK